MPREPRFFAGADFDRTRFADLILEIQSPLSVMKLGTRTLRIASAYWNEGKALTWQPEGRAWSGS
jgi:hypothetical protein